MTTFAPCTAVAPSSGSPFAFAALRRLVKAHPMIVQDSVRVQSRIKAVFRFTRRERRRNGAAGSPAPITPSYRLIQNIDWCLTQGWTMVLRRVMHRRRITAQHQG
jgi:hypothetical protein